MHTVKGNARTYGLKKITETVHLIENSYDHLRKNDEAVWQPEVLLQELSSAQQSLAEYSQVFYQKLGRSADTNVVKLPRAQVQQLVSTLNTVVPANVPESLQGLLRDTYATLISADAKPMGEVISGVLSSVASLADELGKPKPKITLDDGGLLIRNEANSLLNNVFMHVFRNAMDHGIEKLAARVAAGKSEQGHIQLTTTLENGMASFAVRDDGKGIALTRIYHKAIEQGMYAADAPRPPAAEIANLIFASGFSTAEQVTEVSGRGVGMDAVKSFLQSEGGNIEVMLDAGAEDADFRSFSTVLRLPAKYFIEPPELAVAS
jgi:chemotaxis protein histidine kinase CheA